VLGYHTPRGPGRHGHVGPDWHPAAPRGIPQIEVTFDNDANGIGPESLVS
jgi:hypothetical protein